jgi:hypothetical protein
MHVDIEPMRVLLTATIAVSGLNEDQFLRVIYGISTSVFGVVTFFYQGGMAIYYHRRRAAVRQALAEEPPLLDE